VAQQFGQLFRLWETSREQKAEEERQNEIREVLWWRRQGCPVPCPLCGDEGSCACAG
jgi:hypothetical protein